MPERTMLYRDGTGPGGAPHYLSIQGEILARASGATSAQYAQMSSDVPFARDPDRELAELATKLDGVVEKLGALQRDVAGVRRRVTLTAFLVLMVAAVGAAVYSGVLSLPQPMPSATPAWSTVETPKKVEPPTPQPAASGAAGSPGAPTVPAPAPDKGGEAVY